ncbi:MAG: DNA-binding response regulator [Roseateles depolymerans]|uniref:DNA-binding response regulator n=1 Tax=Roseateles depolymerans TaxID=76731 RepID=A0A2W5FEY6_9BURK|nr:MAG: DNA-binding response regulator [Roseateles depolymerans]
MKLLLAEDDTLLADALQQRLGQAAYQVEWADNGAVADYLLRRQDFDIAILDLGLPLMDGLTVLRRAREAGCTLPILVLTAQDDLEHRLAGLNAGADDYVIKPFDMPELEARLQALLRRSRPAAPTLQLRRLTLDRAQRRASVAGQPVELSPREWVLLELLLAERDRVVAKAAIVQAWSADGEEAAAGSIEVYIHRLRRKLEGSGLAIRTARGLGYLLETAGP